eukprot:TRINITY_DN5050_c0_g1_i1.p1 TRINITY_DN5050_c0_g1~~TRINITY_DN5050_c0_g1_i1.p1  ORF type:complete len:542 (+),score=151.67 TRINITY_DN5050_c0_g1_i1:45-1670(+)
MVFTVLVAGKVGGGSQNYEIQFPKRPKLDALIKDAEREFSLNRHDIKIKKMKVKKGDAWEDVHREEQVTDYCQLYVVPEGKRPPSQPVQQPLQARSSNTTYAATTTTTTVKRSTSTAQPRMSYSTAVQSHAVPTFPEKVKFCFSCMEDPAVHLIRREGFMAAFHHLPAITNHAPDIFTKADTNNDMMLDTSEFHRFGEIYPTILDCLYYRLKDDQLRKNQEDEMRRQENLKRNGQAAIDDARRLHQDALSETARLEDALQKQTNALTDAHRKQQNVLNDLEKAKHATQQAKADLQDLINQKGGFKDEEIVRKTKVVEIADKVKVATIKVTEETAKRGQAEQRLAEIRKMLEEQERVVRHHDTQVKKFTDTLTNLRDAHQVAVESVDAVGRDKQDLENAIKDGEARVAAGIESVRNAMTQQREKENVVAREQAKRDLIERELQTAHEKEALCRADTHIATREIGDADGKLAAMKQEHELLLQKIKQAQDEDGAMLRQEVALRGQREDLEKYEADLRTDHRQFLTRQANRSVVQTTVFSHSMN